VADAGPELSPPPTRRILRDNGLSIVLVSLFLAFWVGQALVGHREFNEEQVTHGQEAVTFTGYLRTSQFWEATSENWESEFLQIFAYIVLTSFLFQRGSAESKDPDEPAPVDRDPRHASIGPDTPWPVRRGGLVLKLYEHSLSAAFLLLFLCSIAIHAVSGAGDYNEERVSHGEPAVSAVQYVGTSRFWFESLQNWQSEFMSIAAMVLLSIFLRQRGSAESKPVDSPHTRTGAD
jgi:hypothetical protein